MKRQRTVTFISTMVAMVTFLFGVNGAHAGPGTRATPPPPDYGAAATPSGGTFYANSPAGVWAYTNAAGTYTSATSDSGTPLRKFVDRLPGLGAANANLLGQYIPVATADTTTYPGSDYYELGLKDFRVRMHSDLPSGANADGLGAGTKIRGYFQINGGAGADHNTRYLGPLIIAKRYDPTKPAGVNGNGKPVRIKFTNQLQTGAAGNLFIPVDTTVMGAGNGPDGTPYTQNRAGVHLHGGLPPWISDGTPHQWTVPAAQATNFKKGLSSRDVPDMPASGAGSMTFYYPNTQSNRLMFYHDHSYGITRLNVYAGEAAGYLLTDPQEEDLINRGVLPNAGGVYRYGIPLIIQDKSFVPQDVAVQDALWNKGGYGDLWFPHVYETNQWPDNPDLSGSNNYGRWDYGPWFWPIFPVENPTLPQPSLVPEAFMDTMVVNGAAYPYLDVQPQPYRFRVLNASNDRFVNLQLYVGDNTGVTYPAGYTGPGATYPTEVKMVDALPRPTCSATVTTNCVCDGTINPAGCFPATWPTDARAGGVPDPAFKGPDMIQIGSEGGFLPKPVVIPAQPVNYVYNRRDIVVLNVAEKALFLGPAERADIIVDFSQFAGKTVILYNDSPAPVPAADPRQDYYTGNPDQTWAGGSPSTLPGYGPNTRTIMQFRVAAGAGSPFSLANLENRTTGLPAAYAASQDAPVVPQSDYGLPSGPFNATYPDAYARIQNTSLTFKPFGSTTNTTVPLKPKALHELFDPAYGRMNSLLAVERPFTNALNQTTIPFFYIDPVTETVGPNETQLWKITHNGVDTHAIHFHLVNVQVINRVGWDGAIRPPDPNELGWKETVRMNPLEDIIVAFKAVPPHAPFGVPDSIRPLDVTQPIGSTMGFSNVDPDNNPITTVNKLTNFGQEFVWHCHLLGHEENDMMRPLVLSNSSLLYANLGASGVWRFDGSQFGAGWTKISNDNAQRIASSGGILYADFGASASPGIWKWDNHAGVWTKLTGDHAASMATSGQLLYADFTASAQPGLWKWNGKTWTRISTNHPQQMIASGNLLYVDFGATGIWKWDETTAAWTKLSSDNPSSMVLAGTNLYVDFAASAQPGLWKYDDVTKLWKRLTADRPAAMAAEGNILYVDFASSGQPGLYRYNGTAFTRITQDHPTKMIAAGGSLYADFGAGRGVWKWDNTWSKLTQDTTQSMVVAGSVVYSSFPSGIWKYDINAWTQLRADVPTSMVMGY